MAVFRVDKKNNYTIMSNHHLRNHDLSLKAKGLLAQMLSLPEDWDYTLKGLSLINRESVDAIRTAVWELEKAGYIIRRQERGSGGKMGDMVYTIYEQPQLPVSPELDSPVLENPTPVKPTSAIPTAEEPLSGNPTQINIDITSPDVPKKDLLITDISNPYQSNPPPPYGTPYAATGCDEMGYEEARETVRENIEYDCLASNPRQNWDRLDEVVDLIAETLCSRKQYIVIAGDEYPAELVKEKLLKITASHIEYVFDCLDQNTTYVRNIKKYLLASLFNAPSTMDSYYSALVNHDMYGDGRRGK
jgi:hypothetical protein